VKSKNKFEFSFVKDDPYWPGTRVNLTGQNAKRFYCLAKKLLIDWKYFSSAILGRFDICFQRNNKSTDNVAVETFLNNCDQKVQEFLFETIIRY